jgi:hypothetical protein
MSNGKNFIPSIHYRDLAQIVSHLVSNRVNSIFVPATDFTTQSLESVVKSLATTTKRKIRISTNEEALDTLLNSRENSKCDCPHRFWNLDLRFAESHRLPVSYKFPQGLVDFMGEVWREFVSSCTNKPCSVLIAGPPSSLKSTLAKNLANRLGIKYVDRVGAIKYVIEAAALASAAQVGDSEDETSATAANDVSQTLDVSQMNPNQALFVELRRAIAVQISQSGDKKKKGGPVDENTLDLATVEFTDALLDALPQELLRQSVKNCLIEDAVCLRSGYVLDIWTAITETSHIYDITNTKPDLQDDRIALASTLRRMNSAPSMGEEDSQLSGSVVATSVVPAGYPEPVVAKLPSMIVEVQVLL